MQIDQLLGEARAQEASDIHLVSGLPPAFRVAGEIIMRPGEALAPEACRALTYALLSDAQRLEFEREQELSVSVMTDHGRVRVTAYCHAGRPEAAIRLCRQAVPSLGELGLPPIIDDLCRRRAGLFLISGPTGAGKTTTLTYVVDQINQHRRCKIVSIEDPVEYVHAPKRSLVIQQEVGTDTPSFPRALRHVLRLDPDVIVVGEMRDLETIETALTAAETGHLVLATLHAPSAIHCIERIVGVFPSSQQNQIALQLGETLQAALGQVLLPRASGQGRVLACELLLGTNAVRKNIREFAPHRLLTTMQTSKGDGMLTLDSSLEALYRAGEITWDIALAHARDPVAFKDRHGRGRRPASGTGIAAR